MEHHSFLKSHRRKELSLIAASISAIMKTSRVDFLQTTDYTEVPFCTASVYFVY